MAHHPGHIVFLHPGRGRIEVESRSREAHGRMVHVRERAFGMVLRCPKYLAVILLGIIYLLGTLLVVCITEPMDRLRTVGRRWLLDGDFDAERKIELDKQYAERVRR